MRFIVHGVDRSTGQEAALPLDASSAKEAESIASLTMLVAEVTVDQTVAEAVPYAQASTNTGGFDWPAGIVRQARVLRALSWVVAGVGALGIVLVFASMLAAMTNITLLDQGLRFLRVISATDIGSSIWLLVLACLMRLAAHFMLGWRELLLQKIDRDN